MPANEAVPTQKMPATILALIGSLLMIIALLMVGFNTPVDCGNINTPSARAFIPLVPGIIAVAFGMRLWMASAWIALGTLAAGIFGFIYVQIQQWDVYAGTIAGCAF
jgi:hypothetical protein